MTSGGGGHPRFESRSKTGLLLYLTLSECLCGFAWRFAWRCCPGAILAPLFLVTLYASGTNNKGSRIARRFAPSLELYLSRPTQPAIFRVTSNKQRSSVQTWPVFGFFATPRLFRDASVLQPMRWVGSWWCPLRTLCNERRGCPIQDRRCSLRSPMRATSRPPKPTLLQRLRATFSAQATRRGRFDTNR